MSRVIFMCGPSGSGKSTYARRLEQQGMVRLSFDVEMWRRGISTVPLPQDVRDEIEADLQARLLDFVAVGRDVVLDFSFWSRRMRDDYRRLLEPAGVVPETIYLATDRETVLDRSEPDAATIPTTSFSPRSSRHGTSITSSRPPSKRVR